MTFGINPIAIVKGEVLKVDADGDKVPDVLEALDEVEKDLATVGEFAGHFDADDYLAILNLLPETVKDKLASKGVSVALVAGSLAKLPESCKLASDKLNDLEAWLKAK